MNCSDAAHELIILGGGAAGLFLAAGLPSHFHGKTLLLDHHSTLGSKVLLSGGGMCNLSNCDSTETFLKHFGNPSQERFLKPALSHFSTEDCHRWFEQKGLALEYRQDGKVFPSSLKASSLVDLLRREASANQVEILRDTAIQSISSSEDSFFLQGEDNCFRSKRLVLCTGGMSFPSTGSDGSGYALARNLGHHIVEPTQGLVGIYVDNYPFTHLAGNTLRNVSVHFFHAGENKAYLKASGDILFTHQGVSGPVILNNARNIRKGDTLRCALIPAENKEKARMELSEQFIANKTLTLSAVLKELGLSKSLNHSLLSLLNLQQELKCGELSKKNRRNLISHLLDFPFVVSRKGSFSSAMVTAGGVELSEVSRQNMESRLHPGLYFAGEILDIDGHTGGYNIQAAFSMASLINHSLKNIKIL